MLSSEHAAGPSCSSKSAGPTVNADLGTAEVPACQDPVPNFSIRDYVFASRSKGVKRNWPFNHHSLQLCLKGGVKDPLPPFEPPDLVRSKPFNTSAEVGQTAGRSEAIACTGLVKTRDADDLYSMPTSDINLQSRQLVDETLGPSPCTSPDDGKSDIDQVGSANESDHADGAVPVALQDKNCEKKTRQTEVAVPSWRSEILGTSIEPSEKKCKFVVKLGTQTDIRRTEDIVSNSSSVSDPMASKTCPVCKVFASTSNTTLNAHIDQCLSVELNAEPVETAFVKPKVKPRKKRLMVDIYKDAPRSTLEDLDRRNGTNWAIDLATPTLNKEVCTENGSPDMVPLVGKDNEREGDVYVDSNGIKIRILSKCSDAPLQWRDDIGSRDVAKNETGKGILMTKNTLKLKALKNKKLKMHGNKSNKLIHSKCQAEPYPNLDTSEASCEAEMCMRVSTESTSNHISGTMRQWVCSKRSDISKNVNKKLSDKTFDKVVSGAHRLARSSNLGFDDSQIPESPTEAFSSQAPKERTTTTEAIGFEQSYSCSRLLRAIPRGSPKPPLQAKVPRSAAALAKRRIKEIGMREANKLDGYDKTRKSTSGKSSKARCRSFSISGPSDGPNKLASDSKKFQKHRSLMRTGKRAFCPPVDRLAHDSGQDHEPDTRHVNKKFRRTSKSTPKKFVKHTEGDAADNDLSSGCDTPVLGQLDDQFDVAQQTEGTEMDCEGEEPETDMPDASVSRHNPADSCNEPSYGSPSTENKSTANVVLAKGYSAEMEDPSSSEQLAHHGHESSSAVNNEMDGWQIDLDSTNESSTSLTNDQDMVPGAPHQDNSSITSTEDSNQGHDLLFGQDSLDSQVSTGTNMSAPTALEDSRAQELEPGPSVRSVQEGITGSLNSETKLMPMARESQQLPGEKPFCCSCQDSISRESQLHHEGAAARPILSFTGKQAPQLQIGRESSSFSTYQRHSTKTNPCLDAEEHALAAMVSAESAMNLPSYTTDCLKASLQPQPPSPSNPILRLMGKNLMVMKNEDTVHQAPNSDYIPRGNYVAPSGFVPPNYQHLSDSAFISRTPATTSHQIPFGVQVGNFVAPPLHSASVMQTDQHSYQNSYRNLVPAMHHPTYMMKEVIVIDDDSPEHQSGTQGNMLHPPAPPSTPMLVPNTIPRQPFYCIQSQSPIVPSERAVGSLYVSRHVSQTEVHYSHLPNPFIQPPAGYISPSVSYPQKFRR